ncbi:MAG TPA: glucosamine-6-phosphate deaminase [Isosphaeraceae bacterium]|nr:glucosamine-6-phosphate deaminase [Isosphaeraceae bacterium]
MPAPARTLETAAGQVWIFDELETLWESAADRIAQTIQSQVQARQKAVLGLATGGTPVGVYRALVKSHQSRPLPFPQVSTYNLDEYYPISPLDPHSYRAYMHEHLFSKVDIPSNRAHVLDGTVPESFVETHCAEFDRWIEHDGGLDLQLLGIGRNGHIGFNEPSDLPEDQALRLPTRKMALHPVTKADAARDFGGDEANVPSHALTVGTRAILAARSILILATGSAKADAVAKSLQGPISSQMPGSFLQTVAPRVLWMIDRAAASHLA